MRQIYRVRVRCLSFALGSLSLLSWNYFFFRKESVEKITFSLLHWLKYVRMKSFLSMGVYDYKFLAPATWETLDEASTFTASVSSSGSTSYNSRCIVSSHCMVTFVVYGEKRRC